MDSKLAGLKRRLETARRQAQQTLLDVDLMVHSVGSQDWSAIQRRADRTVRDAREVARLSREVQSLAQIIQAKNWRPS